MKTIFIIAVIMCVALASTNLLAWEAPVISANGYKCSKDQNGQVGCMVRIDEIPGGAVFEAYGINAVTMAVLIPSESGANSTYIHYSSITGCKQYKEVEKNGRFVKGTAINRKGVTKTSTSENKLFNFCKEGLDF